MYRKCVLSMSIVVTIVLYFLKYKLYSLDLISAYRYEDTEKLSIGRHFSLAVYKKGGRGSSVDTRYGLVGPFLSPTHDGINSSAVDRHNTRPTGSIKEASYSKEAYSMKAVANSKANSSIEKSIVKAWENSNLNFDYNFSLPWKYAVNASSLRNSSWFQHLIQLVSRLDPNEPVFTVCSDITFENLLLNWLVSALVRQKQPPKNILVVTNSLNVCSFLEPKMKVECLMMSANDLVYDNLKIKKFNQLLVIRLTLMRILNHMGYQVMNMDADAIMLKNPIPILEQYGDSDIVGTFGGSLPKRLYKKWGLVMCMGAILIRSTPATEMLWEKMSNITLRRMDDQVLFNGALEASGIIWKAFIDSKNTSLSLDDAGFYKSWEGYGSGGLKVSVLPMSIACRGDWCIKDKIKNVYIWHHGRNKHRSNKALFKAKEDNVWFLPNN